MGVFREIDELQDLGRAELSALVAALHRIGQDGLPLLVAAAGLPSLIGLLGEAASYSERLFEFRVLHGLDPEEARRPWRRRWKQRGSVFGATRWIGSSS